MILFSTLMFSALTFIGTSVSDQDSQEVLISPQENQLYEMIMDYRDENGLPAIPISTSLTFVAKAHCKDLIENAPDLHEGCSQHSWSNHGSWSACCHGVDGSNPDCIWEKPKELTQYPGVGYEIVAGSSQEIYSEYVMTPVRAMDAWMNSEAHNCVLINLDPFLNVKWGAIGVGMEGGFACVWFGQEIDTLPPPEMNKQTD